jgi:aryl-alcohol dehydrogenase-like predicted oxidoreductase
MTTRRLGSTSLTVTPLGLGLAALGRPQYINLGRDADLGADRSVAAMEQRCHDLLDAAYDAGVRYVDAARSYGLAEAFLASWIDRRRLAPGTVTVGSKWGYTYVGNWQPRATVHEVKDLSCDALTRQLAESRSLLGRHLALYQIHSATLESGVLDDARLLGRLAGLSAEGIVVGLTVSGPRQPEVIRRALAVEVDGTNPFGCVQATWNLLEPSAGPALADAHARGWGVVLKESLANGRLAQPIDRGRADRLDELGRVVGASRAAVALAAALAQPWADVVLMGAVTRHQVQGNLDAQALHLDPADLDALGALVEPPETYWARRAALAWT